MNPIESLARDVIPADWMKDAACRGRDPEIWFQPVNKDLAIHICSKCPVRQQCEQYSIETKTTDGIYGGLTPEQRRAQR